jgi:hypothetical protein
MLSPSLSVKNDNHEIEKIRSLVNKGRWEEITLNNDAD